MGADRQLTATALADLKIEDFGSGDNTAHLARGDDYPDALAGGQHAGGDGAHQPLLLTASPTTLSAETADHLQRHGDLLQDAVGVVGGPTAVGDDTWNAARRAAERS